MPNLKAAFIIGLIINKVDKVVIISTVTLGLAKYCKVIIKRKSGECGTGWGILSRCNRKSVTAH